MQIFATYDCPIKSAKFLDNKRVVKQVLESTQLLSTTLYCYCVKSPYKPTHINHPLAIWTRESDSNYLWLIQHLEALCKEYTLRYNKVHKCEQFIPYFKENSINIQKGYLRNFINCTDLKDMQDTHLAYRKYLRNKWKNDKRKPKWR
jgi:Pyrimidine dimer DNA glycosylase